MAGRRTTRFGTIVAMKADPLPTLDVSSAPGLFLVGSDGRVRLEGGRVPIERVLYAHEHGEPPENIARDFALALCDVYSVIGFCLRNRVAVQTYVEALDSQAEALKVEVESEWPESVRARMNDILSRAGRGAAASR